MDAREALTCGLPGVRQHGWSWAPEERLASIVDGVPDAFCVLDRQLCCAHLNTRALLLLSDVIGRPVTRQDLVGRPVADVVPGFAGSDLEAQVRTAVHDHQRIVFELPSGERWFRLDVTPSPQGATVAVRDITSRRLADAERLRRTRQAAALADLANLAATGADLPGTLDRAVGPIAAAVGADVVLVAEREEGAGCLRLRAGAGCPPEAVGRRLGPADAGALFTRALGDAHPVESGVATCSLWDGDGDGDAAGAAVGIPGADGPFGVLAVLTQGRAAFERDEIDVLRTAAGILGTAARRAHGGRALMDAREEERPPDTGARLRLLLVQGQAATREAMAAALAAEPDVGHVRQAASLAQARAALGDADREVDHLDAVLIDLVLPDGTGVDLVDDVRRHRPAAHSLILTSMPDPEAAAAAVARGAAGVLGVEACLRDVTAAIRRVRRGEPLLSPAETVELLRLAGRRRERELDDRRALASLTARELEVLQLLADGLDNRAAAERMHVSPRTHRNHLANILAKLGVHSQLQALLFALRYGIVELARPA